MGSNMSDISSEDSAYLEYAMEFEPEYPLERTGSSVYGSWSNFEFMQCANEDNCGYCGYCGNSDMDMPSLDPLSAASQEIPFGNGEWVPLKPEPEDSIYWMNFPWYHKLAEKYVWRGDDAHPESVWKLIAGKKVTHLSERCLEVMTPKLSSKFIEPHRLAPQVLDFGPQFESVLEYFTESMLGLSDSVPSEKQGLLNKLFDETGFVRHKELEDDNNS